MERHAFRAMGTDMELLLDAPRGADSLLALASAECEIRRLEAVFTRFREDSQLSMLNRRETRVVGPELAELTALSLVARTRSGGRFDPTVHDAMVSAGYDRTFDELTGRVAVTRAPVRCGGAVTVDLESGVIDLEPGFCLDLGGIAKGYAADRVCDLLSQLGPCLVDAGGDIAVRGGGWPVGIETPDGVITIELSDGAVATSGVDRRRWQTTGGEAHHLIDPRTGRPAETDLVRVTVVADTATAAEALATSLVLAGAERARCEADAVGRPALLVTSDGRTILAGGLS